MSWLHGARHQFQKSKPLYDSLSDPIGTDRLIIYSLQHNS